MVTLFVAILGLSIFSSIGVLNSRRAVVAHARARATLPRKFIASYFPGTVVLLALIWGAAVPSAIANAAVLPDTATSDAGGVSLYSGGIGSAVCVDNEANPCVADTGNPTGANAGTVRRDGNGGTFPGIGAAPAAGLPVNGNRLSDAACLEGDEDPGDKGVALPPYDPTTGGVAPIIRPGDPTALQALIDADVRWVRLGFQQKSGLVSLPDYDWMVDSLCASGIGVLGLINHETLVRQDADDPTTAQAYREEFAEQAEALANYFEGRITVWEVWNEENYDPDPGPDSGMPYVRP